MGKKTKKASPTASTTPLRSSNGSGSTRNDAGFTLIEVLIVIGLIGFIMTLFLPGVGLALKENLNNASREVATLIREAHDEAVLKGQVYRVAFDLDRGEYWVEQGERNYLLRTAEQEDEEKKRNERRSDDEKEAHKEPFSLATAVTKKKKSLPLGVKFTEILTPRSKDPVKAGVVYAHMFPFGFVERAVIHLKDDLDRDSTLVVSPVTGKSRLYQHYAKNTEVD